MNSMTIKERNYKQVQLLRQQNAREAKRLDLTLNSRHGLLATQKYLVEQMEGEQRRLKRELQGLTFATPKLNDILPQDPRRKKRAFHFNKSTGEYTPLLDGGSPTYAASLGEVVPRRGRARRRFKNSISTQDLTRLDGVVSSTRDAPASGRTTRSLPSSMQGLDMTRARDNVKKRLTHQGDVGALDAEAVQVSTDVSPLATARTPGLAAIDEVVSAARRPSPTSKPSLSPTHEKTSEENVVVSPAVGQPEVQGNSSDASRDDEVPRVSMYRAPEETPEMAQKAIEEAMKARYVRSTVAREMDRELSVSEIFSKNKSKKT